MAGTGSSVPRHALMLTGPTACGKSTIGRLLSAGLSWPLLSFGAHVRREAQRRGMPQDRREELERLGAQLIASRGHGQLLQDLLQAHLVVDRIILDGVRHTAMLQAVKQTYPAVLSVYLDAPVELRYERWRVREGRSGSAASRSVFDGIALGKVERHVYALMSEVDHVADGARPALVIADEICSLLAGGSGYEPPRAVP